MAALILIVLAAVLTVIARIDRVPLEPRGAGDEDAQVYLFVGADSGIERDPADPQYTAPDAPEVARADVVVLVRVSDDGELAAVSVPRDLLVTRPGERPTRLALTLPDGPQAVADGVCSSLGVAVDRYVSIDTAAFADTIDALGGLDLEVPNPVRDPAADLDLPRAGSQTIDGADALALVRSRHGEQLIDGDWIPASPSQGAEERARWAGVVLEGVRQKLAAAGPLALTRAVWAASGGLTVGGGLHPGEWRRLSAGDLALSELPLEPTGSGLSLRAGDAAMRTLDGASFATDCPLLDRHVEDDGSGFVPSEG